MSVQYHKEIFSNEQLVLKVNFFGLKDDIANADHLSMSVYAYDRATFQPLFRQTLNYSQIKSLYDHLNQISILRNSENPVSSKFIESTSEISDILSKFQRYSAESLQIILAKFTRDERNSGLLGLLSEQDIEYLFTNKKEQVWRTEIKNLIKLLDYETKGNIVDGTNNDPSLSAYHAGQPEKIFQNWLEKNYQWVFGIEYLKKHDARKVALYSEGDMLMESLDGYLDLIELKRPSHTIFGPIDSSHKSFYPSTDLSKVIGQCLFYLQKMDDMKLILEKEYTVKIIRPRIKIIIGRTHNFDEVKFNALRMLNCQLTHLEIISYDSLVKYGERMITHLQD